MQCCHCCNDLRSITGILLLVSTLPDIIATALTIRLINDKMEYTAAVGPLYHA